ncbi:hypothetical protein B484DRAFT_455511 [Ochromonadaceae sp. CCMP2298]|nr:hypothetical protein B484DRAFT_455511 [Ochromonadaceae sp. CCMP2298]
MAGLTPSDVLHGMIIKHMVLSCRSHSPMLVLCYLSEAIAVPRSAQYASFEQFAACFRAAVPDSVGCVVGAADSLGGSSGGSGGGGSGDSGDSGGSGSFVEVVRAQMLSACQVPHSFFTEVEAIQLVMESAPGASQNELSGPNLVTPESPMGVFVRALLVQWECLQFHQACALLQGVRSFLGMDGAGLGVSAGVGAGAGVGTGAGVGAWVGVGAGADVGGGMGSSALAYTAGTCEQVSLYHALQLQLHSQGACVGMGIRTGMGMGMGGMGVGLSGGAGFWDESEQVDFGLLAQRALMSGDVAVAEAAIHRLHDATGCDPLAPPLTSLTSDAAPNALVQRALCNLLSTARSSLHSLHSLHTRSDTGQGQTQGQGQGQQAQAMLDLASMWVRAGNATMALSAVEEALKTAHQRGDHASVAQALLLLAQVLQNSQEPELLLGAEDALLRCAKRSAALQLGVLTARAAVQLVTLRASQPLRWSVLSAGVRGAPLEELLDGAGVGAGAGAGAGVGAGVGALGIASEAAEARFSMAEVWAHMSCALLGEAGLTAHVLARNVVVDSEGTGTGAGMGGAGAGAGRKEVDAPLSVGPVLIELSMQAAVVGADLWARAGMLHMAATYCLRALALFAPFAAATDLVAVYTKLLLVLTDMVQVQVREGEGGAGAGASVRRGAQGDFQGEQGNPYQPLLLLARRVRALFPAKAPHTLWQRLEGSCIYVLARHAMWGGQVHKARRLAGRLQLTTGEALTEQMVRARLLLAEAGAGAGGGVTGQLSDLAELCRRSHLTYWFCLVSAIRAKHMLGNAQTGCSETATALVLLQQTLGVARSFNIGSVEAYIQQLLPAIDRATSLPQS